MKNNIFIDGFLHLVANDSFLVFSNFQNKTELYIYTHTNKYIYIDIHIESSLEGGVNRLHLKIFTKNFEIG
jgi:hypothetical protein